MAAIFNWSGRSRTLTTLSEHGNITRIKVEVWSNSEPFPFQFGSVRSKYIVGEGAESVRLERSKFRDAFHPMRSCERTAVESLEVNGQGT